MIGTLEGPTVSQMAGTLDDAAYDESGDVIKDDALESIVWRAGALRQNRLNATA